MLDHPPINSAIRTSSRVCRSAECGLSATDKSPMGFLADSYSGLGTDCAREARMRRDREGRPPRGDASAAAIELVGRGSRGTHPPEWGSEAPGGDGLGGHSGPLRSESDVNVAPVLDENRRDGRSCDPLRDRPHGGQRSARHARACSVRGSLAEPGSDRGSPSR